MNTRKLRVGLLLIAALMLISSCGIPSYLQCTVNYYQVSNNPVQKKITGKVLISDIFINTDPSDGILDDSSTVVSPFSPSTTFFYTLSNSNNANSSLVNAFDKAYSSENNRSPKSASLTINQTYGFVFEDGKDANALRLYPFTVESEHDKYSWVSPNGHINKSMTHTPNLDSFSIDYSPLSSDGYLDLSFADSGSTPQSLKLKRYDEQGFISSDFSAQNDYLNVSEKDPIYLNIYLAVNIVGSNTANFNNRFWSNLYYIGSFEI